MSQLNTTYVLWECPLLSVEREQEESNHLDVEFMRMKGCRKKYFDFTIMFAYFYISNMWGSTSLLPMDDAPLCIQLTSIIKLYRQK